MFTIFINNNVMSSHQSRFKPSDFDINQLLTIAYDIYQSFDEGLKTRSVFLDISKVINMTRYDMSLIFKKHNGISDNLLCALIHFLNGAKQNIVLKVQLSSSVNLKPQGSFLEPLLVSYNAYIIKWPFRENIINLKPWADGNSLVSAAQKNNHSSSYLNQVLTILKDWVFLENELYV